MTAHHPGIARLQSLGEQLLTNFTWLGTLPGFTKEDDTYTKTITKNVGSKIGVYGQVVDDFLSIDKNYIWTIATSALQEVDRQLQAEKTKVASLEARISALENN